MLLEATSKAVRYHLRDGREVLLQPGVPVEMSDGAGRRLLEKAGGRVRIVSPSADVVIEAASPSATPVFWEGADGRICGPASPEHFLMIGSGDAARFWLLLTFEGSLWWIRSDLLRSRQAFEQQPPRVCACCGGHRFWLSIHDSRVCAVCHPPRHERLVRAWL